MAGKSGVPCCSIRLGGITPAWAGKSSGQHNASLVNNFHVRSFHAASSTRTQMYTAYAMDSAVREAYQERIQESKSENLGWKVKIQSAKPIWNGLEKGKTLTGHQ